MCRSLSTSRTCYQTCYLLLRDFKKKIPHPAFAKRTQRDSSNDRFPRCTDGTPVGQSSFLRAFLRTSAALLASAIFLLPVFRVCRSSFLCLPPSKCPFPRRPEGSPCVGEGKDLTAVVRTYFVRAISAAVRASTDGCFACPRVPQLFGNLFVLVGLSRSQLSSSPAAVSARIGGRRGTRWGLAFRARR